MRRLPRTVLALGLVSLLTDLASEMVYPLLPLYLTGVLGVSAAALGVVEGTAEATAALTRLPAGWLSDRLGRRKGLIVVGYSVAAVARPLIGLASSWWAVLTLRFADRLGKGLRGSPRDALIAEVTEPERHGAAFGFHRAMDHAGALAGPLLAAALLGWGLGMRELFWLTAVPGAAVILACLLLVRDAPTTPVVSDRSVAPRPGGLSRLLAAVGIFALGNASDAFLLLALSEAGASAAAVAALWGGHHGVKMVAAGWGGGAADRWGRRRLLVAGWTIYALVYLAFAAAPGLVWSALIFLLYGAALGLAEPAEKAWVAALAGGKGGTSFGWYHLITGLAALPASVLFGALWTLVSPAAAFGVGAGLAVMALLALARVPVSA